jgi:serine/threonine protein kinase
MFSAGCTIYCGLSALGSPFSCADPASAILRTLTLEANFEGNAEIESLSPQGKNLLKSLLEKDPRRRATANQALQDPWLQKALLG